MTELNDLSYLRRRAAAEWELAQAASGSAAAAHAALAQAYERRIERAGEPFGADDAPSGTVDPSDHGN